MEHQYLQKHLYILAAIGLAILGVTAHLYAWGPLQAVDSGGCRGTYMYPSYARIKSFDETHTEYALKYSLYLYREQGKDPVPEDGQGFTQLTGVPALFIPGNAGSYRQVRSIAAECANLYFGEEASELNNPYRANYDFFTADFNEDFTAFHGRTLLDQSEYLNQAVKFILQLYADRPNAPTSVVILAHSMGGIVARVMLTLDSYVPDSINTIVTLASPHSASPLTFDGDILKVYLAADRFWVAGFNTDTLDFKAQQRLRNVSLISITGGALDSVLPADYTALGFLVPPENGFTVYTTGIPEVWTAMDHLAIVWCHQLRRRVLKALMEVIDSRSSQRTYPLQKRMKIFSDNLLTGFESISPKQEASVSNLVNLKIDVKDTVVYNGPEFLWRSSELMGHGESFFLLPINENSSVLILNDKLLNPDIPLDLAKYMGVYLCRRGTESSKLVDFTTSKTNEFMQLTCLDVHADLRTIPRSTKDINSAADSSLGGDKRPFQALQYQGKDLGEFDKLLVVDQREKLNGKIPAEYQSLEDPGTIGPKSGFLIVQTSNTKMSTTQLRGNMFSLIRNGAEISMLSSRPLALNVNIPGAWSSILAYKVRIKQQSGKLFAPFIRQWKEDPYETKWIVNIKENCVLLISMHGIAPFTPFIHGKLSHGLNLEIWSDPEGGWSEDKVPAVEVMLSIDWYNSLKLLVLRYRIAVVSFCFAVAVASMLIQIVQFNKCGRFLGFIHGLAQLAQPKTLIFALIVLSALTPLVKIKAIQVLLDLIDPVVLQDPNEINLSLNDDFTLNSFFLGLEETPLFFAGPLFYIMAIGINFVLYYAVVVLAYILITIANWLMVLSRRKRPASKTISPSGHKGAKRKFVMTVVVLVMVLFYLPYQFTYMISFLIQAINCLKVLWNRSPISLWHFNISMLLIMLWVLPINVPVLVVFIHNMALRWTTPFSSHHNFLAVAPILILVELLSFYTETSPFGKYSAVEPRQQPDSILNKVTMAILGYTIAYSLIYGVRHTYWLHHLFNVWCGWLILLVGNQISVAKEQYKHH